MPFALVETSGRVAQIEDEEFDVHRGLVWLPVGVEVTTGYTYDFINEVFIPPVVEPPDIQQPTYEEVLVERGLATARQIEDAKRAILSRR